MVLNIVKLMKHYFYGFQKFVKKIFLYLVTVTYLKQKLRNLQKIWVLKILKHQRDGCGDRNLPIKFMGRKKMQIQRLQIGSRADNPFIVTPCYSHTFLWDLSCDYNRGLLYYFLMKEAICTRYLYWLSSYYILHVLSM